MKNIIYNRFMIKNMKSIQNTYILIQLFKIALIPQVQNIYYGQFIIYIGIKAVIVNIYIYQVIYGTFNKDADDVIDVAFKRLYIGN